MNKAREPETWHGLRLDGLLGCEASEPEGVTTHPYSMAMGDLEQLLSKRIP
jgi:hypothetical protein